MSLAALAAISMFLGLYLMTRSVVRRREDPLQARVRDLAKLVPHGQGDAIDLSRPFTQRVLAPISEAMSNAAARLLPTTFLTRARHLLLLAGQPMTPAGFQALIVASTLGATLFYVALVFLLGGGFGGVTLVGFLFFVIMGFYAPYFWLSRKVGRRQGEIIKSLPNALDLITTCVEAGLGLDSAFARLVERMPGPFPRELSQALREMAMGRSRRDALRDVGERTGLQEVITFVNSIIHAETAGSSIGEVLRVQADQIRTRHHQRAEQVAQRIPIWMTFPLVFFLLPSLFVAIMGPAIIQVWDSLSR